jgi:hypothetical protein
MSNFIIYNSEGAILRTGSCPEAEHSAQIGDGEYLLVGEAELTDRVDTITGQVIPVTVVAPQVPAYIQARLAAYPPAAVQLDDFWHAMNSGVLPKVEPFFSRIAAIKTAYPKDWEGGAGVDGAIAPPDFEV